MFLLNLSNFSAQHFNGVAYICCCHWATPAIHNNDFWLFLLLCQCRVQKHMYCIHTYIPSICYCFIWWLFLLLAAAAAVEVMVMGVEATLVDACFFITLLWQRALYVRVQCTHHFKRKLLRAHSFVRSFARLPTRSLTFIHSEYAFSFDIYIMRRRWRWHCGNNDDNPYELWRTHICTECGLKRNKYARISNNNQHINAWVGQIALMENIWLFHSFYSRAHTAFFLFRSLESCSSRTFFPFVCCMCVCTVAAVLLLFVFFYFNNNLWRAKCVLLEHFWDK